MAKLATESQAIPKHPADRTLDTVNQNHPTRVAAGGRVARIPDAGTIVRDMAGRTPRTQAPTLVLTRNGHLTLSECPDDSAAAGASEAAGAALHQAFERGVGELFLCLATLPEPATMPPVFGFWRGFGERYLTELCHVPEPAEDLKQPLAAPLDKLAEMVAAAPPMRGGEYLRTETLAGLWQQLDADVRRDIAAGPGGLGEWLKRRLPSWHRVGRVCFHLAENKRDAECPFAFLATYAPKLIDGGRVQYQPLGRALEQYAGARNRKLLVHLLTPVQRAAERCTWVKELVDSGEVFHALRWTPSGAHRLLRDIPVLEESGLLVRVPNWWTKRPPRVRVGVSIGNQRVSQFGVDGMLDFRVDAAFDGEPLTPEEWRRILDGADGLVLLKGQWVEVDREKLRQTLAHWKRLEQEAGADGVSFLQGMRLLAGASIDADTSSLLGGQDAAWAELHAGDWLAQLLRQIRQPESADVAVPPRDLRATLRPYQQTGVKWLWLLTRLGLGACLADDMGLGKTIQVLTLMLMLKKQRIADKARPVLLVLPASLLANWKAEIERFAPSLRLPVRPSVANEAYRSDRHGEKPRAYLGRHGCGVDDVRDAHTAGVARWRWLVDRGARRSPSDQEPRHAASPRRKAAQGRRPDRPDRYARGKPADGPLVDLRFPLSGSAWLGQGIRRFRAPA